MLLARALPYTISALSFAASSITAPSRVPKLVGGICQRCKFIPAFFDNLRLAGMVRLEIGKDFLFLIVKIKLFRMFFKRQHFSLRFRPLS